MLGVKCNGVLLNKSLVNTVLFSSIFPECALFFYLTSLKVKRSYGQTSSLQLAMMSECCPTVRRFFFGIYWERHMYP